jgi:outer membrane immunogenic protein
MRMSRVVSAAAVLATSLCGTASAADLALRSRAVYAAPVRAFYNWTGCYVGGNGGGFWVRREWSDDHTHPFVPFFTDQVDTKSLASVTGRVGFAWNHFLIYAKGGGAWIQTDFNVQTAAGSVSSSGTRSGWTVGIGGEYAFLQWLTGFIEYDHYGFGDHDNGGFGCGFACPFVAVPTSVDRVDVLKAGLNFKFGPFTRW